MERAVGPLLVSLCGVWSGEEQKPGDQEQYLRAEHDGDGGDGPQPLARVDRGCHEPPEDEPSREAAEVGGVAHVGDRDPQVEVQGEEDQELPEQGVLPGEGPAPQRVPEDAPEQPEDRAGRADRGDVEAPEVQVSEAAGDPAEEVERKEAASSELLLHEGTEEVEREHVEAQVDDS